MAFFRNQKPQREWLQIATVKPPKKQTTCSGSNAGFRGSGFLFVFSVIEVSSLNELGKQMCVCHVFFCVCHMFMLQLKKVASLASSKKEVV